MKNARKELKKALEGKAKIKCASICKNPYYYNCVGERLLFKLPINYTDADLIEFYNSLDFTYNEGCESKELVGTIWLEDGSWLSRIEYEWCGVWSWSVMPKMPMIPKNLLGSVCEGELRYTIASTHKSSSRFGKCEKCGTFCDEVFRQSSEKYFEYIDDNDNVINGWATLVGLYGCEKCLLEARN